MKLLTLVTAFAATATLAAQDLTWAEGSQAADLAIFAFATASPGATPRVVLQHAELLPIEITNRTAQQALRDRVSRLVERQGLRRVALPDGGSLYAYRRDGGQHWGFLSIAADGTARIVLERPGTGPNGTASPFLDRIAVSPGGGFAAVPLADFSVLAIRLDGGRYASTNAAWRPINIPAPVEHFSMCAGSSHLFCGTQDDRVWRVAWADGAAPQDVSPPVVPNLRLKGEFAPSADGRHVVFLYGPRDQYTIYLLGDTGPAVPLPPVPAKYEEPGYLPETPNGPRLLLNDDATRLFYVDGTIRDETYVLDVTGLAPTTAVTDDSNFQPYIGVVVLPIAYSNVFVSGIGDVQRFDLFAASTASPVVTNLTGTSGVLVPPYAAGNLVPRAISFADGGTLLTEIVATTGGPASLWALRPNGPALLAANVTDTLRRGAGWGSSADYHAGANAGDLLLQGGSGAPVLASPAGIALSTSVVGANDAWRMTLVSGGGQRALVFALLDGSLLVFPVATDVTEAIVTQSGGLALNATSQLLWIAPSGIRTVSNAASVRWVLSGQGTAD